MSRFRCTRGFSLVEILVVLAIMGLLAAIAIPMYINAQNRAKQSQTMANIHQIAVAWEARAIEMKTYNAAGDMFDLPAYPIGYTDLATMLEPKYIGRVPQLDAWNHPFEFAIDQPLRGGTAATTFSIRSPGRDGVFQGIGPGGRRYEIKTFDCFDCDIVFADGQFITKPEGAQHN